ncbi:MAG TPA: sulfite exporter TauE/SafE family protein [Verrucomicrobiae bacterium]|nr:sulfite exporter TauE/SafE family protein [Verrucomicrobiae bacterium]
MSGLEIIVLAAAAGLAGVMNAVAGGGTLVTFPALLFVGTSPITANATSTLALVCGTAGSLYGFRRQIAAVKPWLKRFLLVSLLGGLLGGVLLTRTEEEVFATMVPFLILFATILFVTQGAFRRFAGFNDRSGTTATPHHRAVWAAVVFQFLVAVYGGYFGAGIGILMLASLGYLGLTDIHEMNALKTVLSTVINQVAAIYFIFAGLIDWPKALVMTAGALVGYFLGAHYSQRIPQRRVRQIITAIGFTISAVMFYRQFR